jgi:hypothetical protein
MEKPFEGRVSQSLGYKGHLGSAVSKLGVRRRARFHCYNDRVNRMNFSAEFLKT